MGLVQKLARLVAVLFAISVFTFLLTSLLPGDPAIIILGPGATKAQVASVRHDLYLDHPLPQRYVHWLDKALHGDLGRSYVNQEPVSKLLRQRLPVTLELLVLAQVLALALAIPAGVFSAYRSEGIADRLTTTTSFGLLSIPDFVLALVLVFVFAVRLRWVPATGYTPLTKDLGDNLRSLALPSIALALPLAAVYTRLLRSDMIATLQEDFVLMARSQGLPTGRILFVHALRPSSFSLLTVAGINMGALIGGAVIIEVLFALPGMGSALVGSIFVRDYLVVQGAVLVIAVGYVLINFVVDLLYAVLDPRIRHAAAVA